MEFLLLSSDPAYRFEYSPILQPSATQKDSLKGRYLSPQLADHWAHITLWDSAAQAMQKRNGEESVISEPWNPGAGFLILKFESFKR